MAQKPAALHPDRTKRPRPHRPALVATPGASEWISRVSSPATNRSGRTLKKAAGNLANSRAALQISLNDPVSQQPVPNFRATVSRRSRRMTCRPAAPGSRAQSRQAPPPARCSGSAKGGASRPCGPVRRANHGSAPSALPSLIGRLSKQRAAPVNPAGSARSVSNSCCCR
jgi:hypothetical protein